jgi:hypothetical protein
MLALNTNAIPGSTSEGPATTTAAQGVRGDWALTTEANSSNKPNERI